MRAKIGKTVARGLCGTTAALGLAAIAALPAAAASASSARAHSHAKAGHAARHRHIGHAARKRTVSLRETGHLSLTRKHGFTLYEKGAASGTIKGNIYIQLKLTSSKRVYAKVNISPRGGWMSGSGSASYTVKGAYAVFSGKLSITKGGGSWRGAHASGLHFSGRIKRRGDAVTVSLTGTLRT